jgi:hypothetical protein
MQKHAFLPLACPGTSDEYMIGKPAEISLHNFIDLAETGLFK